MKSWFSSLCSVADKPMIVTITANVDGDGVVVQTDGVGVVIDVIYT